MSRAGLLRLDVWDWPGAREDFERGLSLDDGGISARLGYASLLITLGQLPEAIAAIRRVTDGMGELAAGVRIDG
jgi:hypothetical protein